MTDYASMVRRGDAIHAYVGPNGSGKTMLAVHDCLVSLRAGRRVLSTCRLLDFEDPRLCDDASCDCDKGSPFRHKAAHPLWIPWNSWQDFLAAENCDVLADEVTGVASSRERALPSGVAHKLMQLRKADVLFRYTAPAWARADLLLREVTQGVTVTRGMWQKTDKTENRLWLRNAFVFAKTYDAQMLVEMTEGKRERTRSKTWKLYRISKLAAASAYDTYESVNRVGERSDAGVCIDCGGTRRAAECTCADYVQRRERKRGTARSERTRTVVA